ncbi:MAG TPA: hypothetical protein VML75_08225 [Kofleriaceae bacterium]|nr:hypothetical protein [Kofleriaceae bacterium]
MSSRTLLIIFGGLIAAGLVALLVALRSGPSSPDSVAANTPAPRAPGPPAAGERTDTRSRPEVAPSQPSTDAVQDDVLEYVTDGGILVRDHRADKTSPANLDGLPRPRRAARMQPESIAAVRGALRPIVGRCERALAAGSLGTEPVLQIVATVSVQSGRLTVDKVESHTKDIADPELGACVRDAFTGHQLDLPGELDVASFDLTHPFRIKGPQAP